MSPLLKHELGLFSTPDNLKFVHPWCQSEVLFSETYDTPLSKKFLVLISVQLVNSLTTPLNPLLLSGDLVSMIVTYTFFSFLHTLYKSPTLVIRITHEPLLSSPFLVTTMGPKTEVVDPFITAIPTYDDHTPLLLPRLPPVQLKLLEHPLQVTRLGPRVLS